MILVTGASGLIGYHLCKRLISDGNEVVGLVNNRENHFLDSLLESGNFEVFKGDIRSEKVSRKVVSDYGVKTIFHTAAQLPYTLNKDLVGVNVGGTITILSIAHEYGVQEFIYASSMGVYSDPPLYTPVDEVHPTKPSTEYGRTKLAGELLCSRYMESMKITVLRYAGVYGLGSEKGRAVNNFIRCALKNEPLIVDGDGSQSSDFVYVDDVVAGTLITSKKGGTYNIGGGSDTTIKGLAELIIELTNSKSEIIFNGKKISRPFRFYLDINKAMDLCYSPRSLSEGLKEYISQWELTSGR